MSIARRCAAIPVSRLRSAARLSISAQPLLACPRCRLSSAAAPAVQRVVKRPIKLTFARPSPPPSPPPRRSALVSTSPPPPRVPPPAASSPPPSSVPLRPSHFLKQFFLRVHPDLFHAPTARVQRSSSLLSADGEPAEDVDVVSAGLEEVRVEEVDRATMRRVNEDNLAKLNELMGYYKQLQALGEHLPIVAAMPRPPSLDAFTFYARAEVGEEEGKAAAGAGKVSFTLVSTKCALPSSHTPAVLVHAIDRFLCRLLRSAGVAIPLSLVAQWTEERRARSAHHQYARMKLHMPWMLDATVRESEQRQMDHVRRDVAQHRAHMHHLNVQERGEQYAQWMYRRGLIRFAAELSDEQRLRAMRALSGLLTDFHTQLHMEEWLGSEIRVGTHEDGYGWEWGAMTVPWSLTQKAVWTLTQEYVRALKDVRQRMEAGEGEQGRASFADLSDEDVERMLGAQQQTTEDAGTGGLSESRVDERRPSRQSGRVTAANVGADRATTPGEAFNEEDWTAALNATRDEWMQKNAART